MRVVSKATLVRMYHKGHAVVYAPRAWRITKNYAKHYREAQNLYKKEGSRAEPTTPIDETRVRVISGADDGIVKLPSNYAALVDRIRQDVDEKFRFSVNCRFFPKLATTAVPALTTEIPEVQRGDVISIQLKNYLEVAGLSELADELIGEIEQRVYGSPVLVDKVYVYRNLVSRRKEQVSWLWHYDNHPMEIRKVMIYLTDVDEQTGPMEYLRSSKTGEPLCMKPRPLAGDSRVSDGRIAHYLARGYETHKLVGPAGTTVLFNDNILHKANIAKNRHRDVIVLQIRPAAFRPDRYIDPRWTGSFEHQDFNVDPHDYEVRTKGTTHSY